LVQILNQSLYKPKDVQKARVRMLAQLHKQIGNQNEKIKLSQILKNATERQCFGRFMRFSQTTNLGEYSQGIIAKPVLEICVNGLLMLKAGIVDESLTLSIDGYVADDADILKVYSSLGVDPYYRIKCNKRNLLGDGYHLYRALEHMNDYHRASFKEIGSYLETLGF
jgi:hypothetical protein